MSTYCTKYYFEDGPFKGKVLEGPSKVPISLYIPINDDIEKTFYYSYDEDYVKFPKQLLSGKYQMYILWDNWPPRYVNMGEKTKHEI